MIQQITTGKATILAVLVPDENCFDPYINAYGDHLCYTIKPFAAHRFIELPPGDWELLGPANDITEEVATTIVPAQMSYNGRIRWNNCKHHFETILKANKCYSENPYGKDQPLKNGEEIYFYEAKERLDELKAWQEAQARTGNWIILKMK